MSSGPCHPCGGESHDIDGRLGRKSPLTQARRIADIKEHVPGNETRRWCLSERNADRQLVSAGIFGDEPTCVVH